MKLIKLTSYSDNGPIYININEIGHFNEGEGYKMNSNGVGHKMEKYTKVGVTTHNDGGFKVKETPSEIIEKIKIIRNGNTTRII